MPGFLKCSAQRVGARISRALSSLELWESGLGARVGWGGGSRGVRLIQAEPGDFFHGPSFSNLHTLLPPPRSWARGHLGGQPQCRRGLRPPAALAAPRPKPFPGRRGSSARQCCTRLDLVVLLPRARSLAPPGAGRDCLRPGAPRLLSRQLGADVTGALSARGRAGGGTCDSQDPARRQRWCLKRNGQG